jgi:hypothetical protein
LDKLKFGGPKLESKTKTLIALAAASALLAGANVASAQNGSTSGPDTSPSVKTHAARVHARHQRNTAGAAPVGDPGTTQRDKDVNYWATHK